VSRASRFLRKTNTMIEIYWGEPLSLVISPEGDVQKFSTIEQAQYWLRRKWPVADAARHAFLNAARSAGFVLQGRPDLPLAA